MSTHAYVGIENSDGSVTYMYVHFDGYVEELGRKLAPASTPPRTCPGWFRCATAATTKCTKRFRSDRGDCEGRLQTR